MKPLSDKNLLELLEKFRSGQCSEAEKEQLQQWFDEVEENESQWHIPESERRNFNAGMYASFRSIVAERRKVRKQHRSRKWLMAAASILFIALIGIYTWKGITKEADEKAEMMADVSPGRNGALLTLANGEVVLLDSATNQIIAKANGLEIVNEQGQLSYRGNQQGQSGETVYNTLHTPKARQYSLVLPDGTKVWLNAGSSIRYPLAFGRERKVEITGEAYFEVAHQKAPFIVRAGETEIIDLGTAFNVYAYSDEPELKATLLQGAIKISDKILQPGQQARIKGQTMKLVNLPNAEEAIAWKKGEISFEDADVATIMRQLSRWYNVKVVYQGAIPKGSLFGSISRQTNLSSIVKILKTYDIHCRIEGDKLIVQP